MILGFSEDRDRVVNIVEDSEKTTAVADNDYEILPCRIPAGKVSDSARIVLKRTDKFRKIYTGSIGRIHFEVLCNSGYMYEQYL